LLPDQDSVTPYLKILNFVLELVPFDLSQRNLSSTLLNGGEVKERGHMSYSCVKQLTQGNAVQMFRRRAEQDVQNVTFQRAGEPLISQAEMIILTPCL